MQALYLFGCRFDDLPSEICGEAAQENVLYVLYLVRAHYKDLKAGQRRDAEVKVLFLGNGGTGKTQLCRRLPGEPFDPSVPTTHGIQLSEKTMELEDFPEPVRLNHWDFGGQEMYHGSHALFLQGQAVFLILWTPQLEQGSYCEGGLTFQRRPLRYWLDYLRAFAGSQSWAFIIQSQCDRPRDHVSHPPATTDDLAFFRKVEVSALTGLGLGLLSSSGLCSTSLFPDEIRVPHFLNARGALRAAWRVLAWSKRRKHGDELSSNLLLQLFPACRC